MPICWAIPTVVYPGGRSSRRSLPKPERIWCWPRCFETISAVNRPPWQGVKPSRSNCSAIAKSACPAPARVRIRSKSRLYRSVPRIVETGTLIDRSLTDKAAPPHYPDPKDRADNSICVTDSESFARMTTSPGPSAALPERLPFRSLDVNLGDRRNSLSELT
jgi:hypothetical protein